MFGFNEEEEDPYALLGTPEQVMQAPVQPKPIDPQVQDFIAKKYNLGEYTKENRDKIAKDNEVGFGTKARAALASIGAGFMGKDAASAGSGILDRAQSEAKGKLDEFDKGRQNHMADIKFDQDNEKFDSSSAASNSFRQMMEANFPQVVKAYGDKWGDVTAADAEAIFKPLQLKEQTDARKEAAALGAGQRRDAADERKLQRDLLNHEKQQKLETPFGLANSEDDAKRLKEGFESKKIFDSKIKEMIALRVKHGGGALLNREDVNRGKQLSKDLLLEYKNMQKLGVLSKADEDIINAIIPADPLQYNSPLEAASGQDSTLHRLKKFQGDSDKDFKTRIATRTRSGVKDAAKGFLAGDDGGDDPDAKVAVLAPNGKTKMVAKKDLRAALANGGTLVDGPMVGGN